MSALNNLYSEGLVIQSQTQNQNLDEYNAKADDTGFSQKKISLSTENNGTNGKNYSPKLNVYHRTGYKVTNKIATTLQGSVYNAINADGERCVLKRTSVWLHKMGVAYVNKKYFRVKENIVNEAKIMKYLTALNPPPGLAGIIDFFCDGNNHFLLMEYGGESMWKHVIEFNHKIKEGKLKPNVWKKHVKILFKQMCVFINWLHNTAKLAHLDISLENMLIKGCVFKNGKFISHGQVNFIDFGLSERYPDKKSFDNCTKYVGKQNYKSPELYHKIPFNAAKSDFWIKTL